MTGDARRTFFSLPLPLPRPRRASLDFHVDVIEPVDHDEEDEDDGEEDAGGHVHVHGVDDAPLAEPSPLLLVVRVVQRNGHLVEERKQSIEN